MESDKEIMEDLGISCPECGQVRSVFPMGGTNNDWNCLTEYGGCGSINLCEIETELPRPEDLSDEERIQYTAFSRYHRILADKKGY
jgi:hypothetical protein